MARFDDTMRRNFVPPPIDRAIADLASRQHGVVALGQLRALGLGARAAQHRAGRGRLHRVHRGVYAVGHPRLSADGLRMAAVLACGPGAVLSHHSAAAAWGLRPTGRRRFDVTTPARGRRGPAAVALHSSRCLDREDATRCRAIPITTVARTLVDLAAVLRASDLANVVHEAEVLRLLDVGAVQAAISRGGGRRRIGALRAALAEPSPGPTRSELERRFVALCRVAGMALPEMNASLHIGDRRLEVDALWSGSRVIVELDSEGVHNTRRAFHTDRRRDAALAAQGYVVVRLTWQRVVYDAESVAAELRQVLATRAPSPAQARAR